MTKNHFNLTDLISFFCKKPYFWTTMYRFSTLLLVLFLFAVSAPAQENNREAAKQLVEIANDAYYNLRVLIVANEQYVQAADMDPENLEANYMAGKTYLETNYKSRATKYLLRVLNQDPEYKFNVLYMIGRSYQYGMDFDKAIEYYNKYLDKLSEHPGYHGMDYVGEMDVQRRIYECENGREYKAHPKDYLILNLGPGINSEWDDYAPVVTADESFMAFTTRRQEGNTNEDVFDDMLYYEDIFYSVKENGKWGKARNIGPPINSKYHDSNLAINADGTQLYLFKSQNGGDIFLSVKQADGSWSEPEPLNDNINSSFSENSVSISPDGTTLFFSSDRPITEDKTDLDIYYSKKDSRGEWGRAKNIGPVINTPYDEDGPFIDYDGKTLYFSSKGHKGMGGYDIYKSVYDSTRGEWSEPINLGYPMNTSDNDVYFVTTRGGSQGYYASAREDGLGFTDIYQIRLVPLESPEYVESKPTPEVETGKEPEPEQVEAEAPASVLPTTMLLKSIDSKTKERIDVNLTVFRSDDKKTVQIKKIDKGLYQLKFENPQAENYTFIAKKPGYMFKNMEITIPAASPSRGRELDKYIALDRLQVGYKTVLRNIYFDFNKATLKPESYRELGEVKKILDQNPWYKIEIAGHTDAIGSKEFNMQLSQRRAQAVVNYLVKQGINPGRLIAKGYGETKPLATNDDEREGRELNRRVEFKVIKSEQ